MSWGTWTYQTWTVLTVIPDEQVLSWLNSLIYLWYFIFLYYIPSWLSVWTYQFSSVQSFNQSGHQGTQKMIQQRFSSSLFCRRPLWAVLAWAGMFTLWCCPARISTADNSVTHPPRCPEGWFWRGCCGMWHALTMQVSVSRQLPEEVPVDPQGSWSCSAPSH